MMYQDDDFMNMVEELKHADKLQWLMEEEYIQNAFRKKTGYDIAVLVKRNIFNVNIDKMAGNEKHFAYHFIVWATEEYWNTPDKSMNIEIYTKAKNYVGTTAPLEKIQKPQKKTKKIISRRKTGATALTAAVKIKQAKNAQ